MNREVIYSALFALISTADGLATASRKLKHWSDVPATQRPALFQAQGRETVMATAANGLPSRWLLEATLYIYVSAAGATSPGEILNPILDAIATTLDPTPASQPQTLDGLVQYARIEGAIETSEGTLGDDEVALIPVRILTI
jgi:hypothetical protein